MRWPHAATPPPRACGGAPPPSRSAQREELSRRCFVAQSAAERVAYRADSLRAAASTIDGRTARARELLSALDAEAAADRPDPGAEQRIAELEARLAELERDREERLARELAELEGQLAAARALVAER